MKRLFLRKSLLTILLIAMTLSLVFTVAPALAKAEKPVKERTVKLTLVHKINGQKINQPIAYPVDIKVYKNGKFHQIVTDFKFGQRFMMEKLPAGMYNFEAFSHATGKLVAKTGAVKVKAGSPLRIQLILNVDKVPTLKVK